MLNSFEGRTPTIGKSAQVHPTADVIGAVVIGVGSWIATGGRVCGGYDHIVIGDSAAGQDNRAIRARILKKHVDANYKSEWTVPTRPTSTWCGDTTPAWRSQALFKPPEKGEPP